jgi:hypothetical protein
MSIPALPELKTSKSEAKFRRAQNWIAEYDRLL